MKDLAAAIAIAMIIEGMMPFISPKNWRETILRLISMPDKSIRIFGGFLMLVGLALLMLVR